MYLSMFVDSFFSLYFFNFTFLFTSFFSVILYSSQYFCDFVNLTEKDSCFSSVCDSIISYFLCIYLSIRVYFIRIYSDILSIVFNCIYFSNLNIILPKRG